MASCHKACLSLEILHFNVKHHMAIDIPKPIGWLLAFGYNLEYDLHIFHFFLYGVSPEGISILLVNDICLIDHLKQLEPKFMGPFKVLSAAFSHHGDDSVPFFQDMMNQPVKCWFIFYAMSYSIFCNLDWMQFLKVGKLLPLCGSVFPFVTNVLISC